MSIFFTSIVALIVTLGLLIAFHEFGHYWSARKLGVKVLRYSIGFGKPLWLRRYGPDQTEYVIAAVPLGGYVKMLDEREGEVAAEEQHRAFNRQSVWKRFTIVAAGPAFNFIFAIFAFWLMYLIGVPGIKPVIGQIEPESPAAIAGLQQGDQIVSVNGEATPTWNIARITLLDLSLDNKVVSLELRDSEGKYHELELSVADLSPDVEKQDLLDQLGITPQRAVLPAKIGEIEQGSPAARSGIQSGDLVLQADDQPVTDWFSLVTYIREHPGKTIVLEIERDGVTIVLPVDTAVVESEGKQVGRIGAGVAPAGPPPDELISIVKYPFFEAVAVSAEKTWQLSVLTLRMIGKMITGDVSVANLSGPITIATYAGYTASVGIGAFLYFLAVVSISLGVLNLLPVPMLDGGHLMYYLIEMVKGSPVSDEVQLGMQKIGIALLVMLMTLALYNDIARLFGG